MTPLPVIAIDGPSGAGKGTVSAAVARHLGWHLLDSGALYRSIGLIARRRGLAADDAALPALAAELDIVFCASCVYIDGCDESRAIRAPDIDRAASEVAAAAPVRRALLARQRSFRRPPGLVADGRDMGSAVFPDAPLKIFLTASARVRAERRLRQRRAEDAGLIDGGGDARLPGGAPPDTPPRRETLLRAIESGIRERDARDRARAASPLRAVREAVTIDTSSMAIDDVVAEVLALWQCA